MNVIPITQGESVGGKRKLDVVAVYLEAEAKNLLAQWAAEEGYRSVSSLAAHILKQAANRRQKEQSELSKDKAL